MQKLISPLGRTILSKNSTSFVSCGRINVQARDFMGFDILVKPKFGNALQKEIDKKPQDRKKKFTLKRAWRRPPGLSKKVQRENELNDKKGTPKPNVISEQNKEIIKSIFKYSKENDPESALNAYQKLSIKPDVKVLTAVIKSCEKDPEYFGEAIEIYHDMKKLAITPNITTFQTLMNCCTVSGRWQRGMWLFKEFLISSKVPTAIEQRSYLRFFRSLLRLLKNENQPDRIVTVHDMIDKYGLLPSLISFGKKQQSLRDKKDTNEEGKGEEIIAAKVGCSKEEQIEAELELVNEMGYDFRREVSLDFVKLFVRDEYEAAQYHKVLNGTVNPEMLESYDDIDDFDAHITYMKEIPTEIPTKGLADYTTGKTVHQMISEDDDIVPKLHYDHPRVEEAINDTVFNLLRTIAPSVKKVIEGTYTKGLEFGCSTEKIRPYLDSLFPSHVEDKIWFTLNEEEALELMDEAEKREKVVVDKLTSNVPHWKPVIIGVDGAPFFPSTIGAERITAETVKSAKQEYLQSIGDPEIRKNVEEIVFDRVKLCFLDERTGRLVEGLFY